MKPHPLHIFVHKRKLKSFVMKMLIKTLIALSLLLSLLHNSGNIFIKFMQIYTAFKLIIEMVLDGQFQDYCIADEQTPEDVLDQAMKWACSNGADCSAIGENGPCYLPNTVKDHSSYAFNSYYQNMKHKGGSCYFNSAALISDLDPSKINIFLII